MLSNKNYTKVLDLLDRYLWDYIVSETGFKYLGVALDYHFESSILSIDYMGVDHFFEENGDLEFQDFIELKKQYESLDIKKRLKLLENILIILNFSTNNKEINQKLINRITNILKKDFVRVEKESDNKIIVRQDDIVGEGSYCNVFRINDVVLRKELKDEYKSDEKLIKRLKYEFENMKKLEECPQVLNVYEYDEASNSYTMEKGEMSLNDYLTSCNNSISLDEKIKIITDVIKGIVFAYEKSIIHRDLHLGNILKTGNDFVICDFGLSKDLSIERSMKSSYTEKNNHIFVDPYAMGDFTKLDHKSDIYSIGKIIEWLFYKNNDENPFKAIVDRCITRDRKIRYDYASDVLKDIESIINDKGKEAERESTIDDIINCRFNVKVYNYIMSLVKSSSIGVFIVKHNLNDFGQIILNFEILKQRQILSAINSEFEKATGWNGWENYEIFANISYYIIKNSDDSNMKSIAMEILQVCANNRYYATRLLEEIESLRV
ncbi:protein kinase [Clostridium perfringens]|nr:protein kinase [Clostridium perfringens]